MTDTLETLRAQAGADKWVPIERAPKNGTTVQLGWFAVDDPGPNDILEFTTRSRWVKGEWVGHWTPTHWLAK